MSTDEIIRPRLKELLKKYNAEVVIDILDNQQFYMKEHQQHVAQIASTIALAMGMSESEEETVFVAANVHDIGFEKSYFNTNIQETKLVGALEELKSHPITGADMLEDLDFPAPIVEIVLQHHERLDGSGFPRGIKDVMIEAQIIAVSDAIEDVLSTHTKDKEQAIKHASDMINNMRDGLIDPEIIDVAIDQLNKHHFVV